MRTLSAERAWGPLALVPVMLVVGCTESGTESLPLKSHPPALRVESLDVGQDQACVLVSDGSVWCWGISLEGEVGCPGDGVSPTRVEELPRAQRIALGTDYSCAQTDDRRLFCWGGNFHMQLGPDVLGGWTPVEVVFGRDADDFSAGVSMICRIIGGAVSCQGNPYWEWAPVPAPVRAVTLAREDPACVLMEDHRVWCWGQGTYGRLGDGTVVEWRETLQPILDPGEDIASLTAGMWTAFGIGASGAVYGWGDSSQLGKLGTGDKELHATPVWISLLPPMRQVDAGTLHSCGVSVDGEALCWGAGADGELGNGEKKGSLEPLHVPMAGSVLEIRTGYRRTCLLTTDREVYCFGAALLGTGDYAGSAVPLRVHFPWEDAPEGG